MDERELLGKRIQELRLARRISQEALAERMGVNAKYLGFIEQGRANPTLEVLFNVARSLKVEPVDLFNYAWLKLSDAEMRRKIKALADRTQGERLREMLALLKSREA
ncbi:helix-turn-helix transcriptional regulator [bacterium]|nr:helix-turn-helix transcriptional regulator [bacterium]